MLYNKLIETIDQKRILHDALSTLALGTDASFYRLIPQMVIMAKDETEVSFILRECSKNGLPVTFRAAGTSLSGQAITDSVLVIAGTALMTLQHKGASFALFRSLSYPFDLMNSVTTGIGDRFAGVWEAKEENSRLKKQLTALLLERQRYAEIMEENKRLKEVLSVKDSQPNYLATARVIARGYDRLLNTIILDKGSSGGIKKDMAVITARGLVGKVYTVKPGVCEALLLRDPNFSVAARLQDGRSEGIISGAGSSCMLKYIPPEIEVKKGAVVISSGLDGIFPPGIPIGVVSKVKREGIGFFQEITVQPFQSDASVEEAVILSK
ncbi:MAG: rod shape-determining protein MreC [Nitrospirales bacterium]|nr:rod shape-determining protein MreC [Nitrospirales bacterium]